MLHIHSPLPSLSSADPLAALTSAAAQHQTGTRFQQVMDLLLWKPPGGQSPAAFPLPSKGTVEPHLRAFLHAATNLETQGRQVQLAGPAGSLPTQRAASTNTLGVLCHSALPQTGYSFLPRKTDLAVSSKEK